MATVCACLLTVLPHVGTTTQTEPVIDVSTGEAFVGKVALFQGGFAAINTLTAGTFGIGGYADFRGVDTSAIRAAYAVEDVYSPFNFKACSGALSLGDHSILDIYTDSFGQVGFQRKAKVSEFRLGEMDIAFDQNDRNGDALIVLVLGGDGFDVSFPNSVNGTYATPTKPQGMLVIPTPGLAGSGATNWGTGGHNVGWGYATRAGAYGTSNIHVVNQGSNFVAQRGDAWGVSLDGSGTLAAALPTVSAWDDLSFTIANNTGGAATGRPMAVCGDLVRTAGGSFLQPTVDGSQTIDLTIDAKAVFIWSVGKGATTDVGSPVAQLAQGWVTAVSQQRGYWSGEKTPGNVSPAYGARYPSNTTVLRSATPNGASTTFHSIATCTGLTTLGALTLAWAGVDGVEREYRWFAIGLDISSTGGGDGTCVAAPPAVDCWEGGTPGAMGCVNPARPSAGCWSAYDASVQRIERIGEGLP